MIPLLRPAIVVALLFRTILAFKVFDEVYLLTSGGPGTSTELVNLHLYKVFFEQNQLGYGALLSLAVIAAIVAFLLVSRGVVRAVRADMNAPAHMRRTDRLARGLRDPRAVAASCSADRWSWSPCFAIARSVRVDPDRFVQVPDRDLLRASFRSRRRCRTTPTCCSAAARTSPAQRRQQRHRGRRRAPLLVLVVGTLAAYSLHRFRWPRVGSARCFSAGRWSSTWCRC